MLCVSSQPILSVRRCTSAVRLATWIAGALSAIGVVVSQPANADPDKTDFGWRQAWTGFDVQKGNWLGYAGMTVAPFANDIHSEGLRLRITGGYGESHGAFQQPVSYSDGSIFADAADRDSRLRTIQFRSRQSYGEALIGYQTKFGNLTAKFFGGAAYIEHRYSNSDGGRSAIDDWGAKGVIELWLDIGESQWTSLDASHTTAFDSTALRWRYGVKLLPSLSLGPELRFDDSEIQTFRSARIGGFVRKEWWWGEASLAAGYSDQLDGWERASPSKFNDRRGGYATVNVMFNF